MLTPDEAIDAINGRFGAHPGCRALHARGTWCAGTFTASTSTRALSSAAHFQGAPVPVLARLSTGAGDPREPDYAPDVRGLAVSFELQDGTRTDLLSSTPAVFPFPQPEGFIGLIRALSGKSAALKFPAHVLRNPRLLGGLRRTIPTLRPLESFATTSYHSIHAYRWVAADGSARHTRCSWIPQAGQRHVGIRDGKSRGRDYLAVELRERLASGGVRFTLQAQVAAPGDDVDNPAAEWPADRERVDVGTLELTGTADDPEAGGGLFVFDPTRVTPGIELTKDPVLLFRAKAYSASVERRST